MRLPSLFLRLFHDPSSFASLWSCLSVENSPGHYGALDEEEQMVQMAVQRSLVEFGTADNLVHRDYSLVRSVYLGQLR